MSKIKKTKIREILEKYKDSLWGYFTERNSEGSRVGIRQFPQCIFEEDFDALERELTEVMEDISDEGFAEGYSVAKEEENGQD